MQNAVVSNKRRAEADTENAAPNQDSMPRVKRQFVAPKMIRKPAPDHLQDAGKSKVSPWQPYKPKASPLARCIAVARPAQAAACPAAAPLPAKSAAEEACQYYNVLYTKRSSKVIFCLSVLAMSLCIELLHQFPGLFGLPVDICMDC